jgi:hypothetical protein
VSILSMKNGERFHDGVFGSIGDGSLVLMSGSRDFLMESRDRIVSLDPGSAHESNDTIPSGFTIRMRNFFFCAESGLWWYPTWRGEVELFYDLSVGGVFNVWRHSSGNAALYFAPRLGVWWIPDAGGINPKTSSMFWEYQVGIRGWDAVSFFGYVNYRGGSDAFPWYLGYGVQGDVWRLFLALHIDTGLKVRYSSYGMGNRDRSMSLLLGVKF